MEFDTTLQLDPDGIAPQMDAVGVLLIVGGIKVGYGVQGGKLLAIGSDLFG
jgi:hypothetical protein